MSNLNWGDLIAGADDAGFTAVPAGEYDAIVDTAEVAKTSGNNGAPKDQIKVKFKVESGPHAGKALFNNFVLSPENPNALGFFFRHMAALGLTREYFQGNPPLTQVAAALLGRRCRVKVSVRIWNEEERNQIDKILPPVGGVTAAPAIAAPGVPAAPVPGYVPAPGMVPATTAGIPAPPVPPTPTAYAAVPPAPSVPPTPAPAVTPPPPMPAPAPMAPPPPLGETVPGAQDSLPF